MLTRFLQPADLPAVQAFLRAFDLPTAEIMSTRGGFLLIEEADQLIAVAGLELHGQVGLLRSVAVAPEFRSRGLAAQLVQQATGYARSLGLTDLYLLTTSAQKYFPRFGFRDIPRETAPADLRASAQFQGVCPDSAVLMHLPLEETKMTSPTLPRTDTTVTFLLPLRQVSPRPLEFRLHGKELVPSGYHVTEVKAVTVESMDCGGKANSWRETVIQLMDGSPVEARQGFMTTQKFLSIYDRVAAAVPIRPEAEVRIEYGNAAAPAMTYSVAGMDVQDDRVVELALPGVQCKATGSSSRAGQCCGPSTSQDLISLEHLT